MDRHSPPPSDPKSPTCFVCLDKGAVAVLFQPYDVQHYGECYHEGFVGYKVWLCKDHTPVPPVLNQISDIMAEIYEGCPARSKSGLESN